ncbi:MAG: calcium/proton exchanger [Anaerolineaceae bacterium]|nr:calcium/proton exchanger [Anaerolineaceae bacterium]
MLTFFQNKPLYILLLLFPLAILAEWSGWSPVVVFALSALAVVPMAGLIGEATESLAAFTGPKIGGLLNATLGNAAELIITLVAIRAGLLELVKASITGSILGNLLLILGLSMLVGGVKNGTQVFDRKHAGNHAILLILAVMALVVPSVFSHSIGGDGSLKVEALSLGVAGILILLYVFGLIYSYRTATGAITHPEVSHSSGKKYSIKQAIFMLAASTLGVVIMSEYLVQAMESVVADLGLSEFFLGIILIPIIGNVAEHLVAVRVAAQNQMELSVEIALSSSSQIALFVAPLLVYISLAMGNPLTLIFNQFELIALGAGVIISALVSNDGESNWLEGLALVAVYLILGLAFFLMPV